MPRPRKDPHLRMDTDLRIPVTAEQKRLIGEAVAHDPRGLAAWARQVLLTAAAKMALERETDGVRENAPWFQVIVDGSSLPVRLLQLTIEASTGSGAEIPGARLLAAPGLSPGSSVDVATGVLSVPRSTVGIVAPMVGTEAASRAVTWSSFEKRCG
jgi:hypothetical protein